MEEGHNYWRVGDRTIIWKNERQSGSMNANNLVNPPPAELGCKSVRSSGVRAAKTRVRVGFRYVDMKAQTTSTPGLYPILPGLAPTAG